eukprot:TRINITY_DN4713_c0_g1_i1.p2 TRINITY_DN4713_c0_g1~~TRINITY_DN4713_c0_g1_i1.p2  ORF type:complete len:276 (-),score=120.94 TRINITY_DN4713_c0_g1_i1:90-917(-)
MTFILLAGICFASYFVFGYFSESYSKVGGSFITTFHNLLMENKYGELSEINKAMAVATVLILAIVLVIVLMTLFNAIIMSNYSLLRRSRQMKIEAMARITRDQGKSWTKKLMNLICCKAPIVKKEADSDIESPVREVNNDVLQQNAKSPKEEHSLSTWNIFLMNLNALFNFQAITSESAKMRQEEAMETLKREQHAARVEEKREQERNVINRIVQTMVYVVFLALFITLMVLHIRVDRLALANNAMKVLIPADSYKKDFIEYGELKKVMHEIAKG